MNVLEHPAVTDPTHANIMDLLDTQRDEMTNLGRTVMDPQLFCPPGVQEQIEQARTWWPRECPDKLGWAVSFGGSLAMHRSPTNTSDLLTHLGHAAARTAAWLRTEGRDVERPNETKSERMSRRNRERAAEHRERNRTAPDGQRPAASVAWDRVVELRRQRAQQLDDADALVREAYQLMTDRAADRKVLKSSWDAAVADAEQAHRDARAAN